MSEPRGRPVYSDYITTKSVSSVPVGMPESEITTGGYLFDHQKVIVRWALRRGRAAVFADTGLGKTMVQLEWARNVSAHGRVLILTPLAVAAQTVREGERFGIACEYARDDNGSKPRIVVANYEHIDKFDPREFVGVVLDESSILKNFNGAIRNRIITAFADTRFRLACTATPAPNDHIELGNHSEFLGIKSRTEMLAEYFVHDGGSTQDWRLKGHAADSFWRWVASWAITIRRPSDLGFDDGKYALPPLRMHEEIVPICHQDAWKEGYLFAPDAVSLSSQRATRRATMTHRVNKTLELVCLSWDTKTIDGLEKRIRSEPTNQSESGLGISREEKLAIHEGQGCAEEVHEGIRESAPGEVQENSRAERTKKRRSARAVRKGCLSEGISDTTGESLAGCESNREALSSSDVGVRDNDDGIRCDDESPGRRVRNMRLLDDGEPKDVSSCGPLSRDGKGERYTLLKVQLRTGADERQPGHADGRSQLLEPWLIWCELNAEQDALEKAFGDLAVSVRGSDTSVFKEKAILRWLNGEAPVMLSKPSIMGFGLNFQHCSKILFAGASHSFEQTYQAIRRCWRFGQTRPVDVHVIRAENESAIINNYRRKESDAARMQSELLNHMREYTRADLTGHAGKEWNAYDPAQRMSLPTWIA